MRRATCRRLGAGLLLGSLLAAGCAAPPREEAELSPVSMASPEALYHRSVLPARDRRLALRLYLFCMTSLPPQTLVAGGQVDDGRGAVCTALRVSGDGGATWRTVDLRLANHRIAALTSWGRRHVWAVPVWGVEGPAAPTFILRSTDAGRTWEALPIELADSGGLCDVREVRFVSAEEGWMRIHYPGRLGELVVVTRDGGASWRRLFDGRARPSSPRPVEIERGGIVPGHEPPPWPVAPVWREAGDGYYTLAGQVRLRKDWEAGLTRVERLGYDDPADEAPWRQVGTLGMDLAVEKASPAPESPQP
jgi:hypothetical protein